MILRTRSIFDCLAIATLTFTLAACGSGGNSATDDNPVDNVSVDDGSNFDGNEDTGESTANNGDDSITDTGQGVGATDDSVAVTEDDNAGENTLDDIVEITEDDSVEVNAPDDVIEVTEGDSAEVNVPEDVVEVTEDDSTGESVPDDIVEVTEDDSTGESVPDDIVEVTEEDSTENVPVDDGVDSTVDESTGEIVTDNGNDSTTNDSTGENASGVDEDSNDNSSSGDSGTPGSPPRIDLDGSIYQSTDTWGKVHLFGILKNTGGSDAIFVKVRCSFFSADSALVKERLTYVKGTNVVLTSIDATTNTALKPGDTGVFEVAPYIDSDEFSTYECRYSYDIANNTRDPDARMELVGSVNVQENYFGDVEYLGQVKNTGVKGLIFGKLYFVTRDTANSIVDVSLTFVNGDTVTLESIDTATDTALKVGSTGTFSAYTPVPLSNYGQHSVMMAWDDSEITDDIARKSDRLGVQSVINVKEGRRTERLNRLRDAYLAN